MLFINILKFWILNWYTFLCISAATSAKNSRVGPNPVPSSPRNSTSKIALRSACAFITCIAQSRIRSPLGTWRYRIFRSYHKLMTFQQIVNSNTTWNLSHLYSLMFYSSNTELMKIISTSKSWSPSYSHPKSSTSCSFCVLISLILEPNNAIRKKYYL